MSCRICGTDYTNLDLCVTCAEMEKLREQLTVAKADRDEAIRTRDEVHQKLMDLLAVIHRDGGQHVGKHGVNQAISDARQIIVDLFSDLHNAQQRYGELLDQMPDD